MSLATFQHALAELVASPDVCRQMRGLPQAVLRRYALTAREQQRLTAVVCQDGMSVNCTLYRASRLEAFYTMLPLTCSVLGRDLKSEAELYWQFREYTELQFRTEMSRFGAFLRQRLHDGQLKNPYVREVLSFELAASDLRYFARGTVTRQQEVPASPRSNRIWRLHPLLRVISFDHDPSVLLEALQAKRTIPSLAVGVYTVLLDARGEDLVVATIDERLGPMLTALETGPARMPEDADIEVFTASGWVVSA